MPIYEYRCNECQQIFEEWCKHIEDADVQHACPICKGKAERLISNTSFALKGGGWYVTEYGSHKGIKEDGASAASNAGSKSDSGACAAKGEAAPGAPAAQASTAAASSPAPSAPAAS